MNFNKNSNEILEEMLNEMPDEYEKSKGYFLWDIFKAIAISIKNILSKITVVAKKLDINNLEGIELEKFITQRTGIERKKATYSNCTITVKGNGNIKVGDLFETEGLIQFKSTEDKLIEEIGTINAQCVFSGKIGNVSANSIKKIPITIQGINSCTNLESAIGGYDAENDADLKNRYFERLREPATSGNIYHYKRWAKEVNGVGDAKVIPLWNGNNTVKTVIINDERLPADEELINKVQQHIDPDITGEGKGEAPIGAFCTVSSADAKNINISVRAIFSKNSDKEQIKNKVIENIKLYLKEIAFIKNTLSYAIIGSKILDIEGVIDYSQLTINNNTINIECEEDEVFVLERVDFIE